MRWLSLTALLIAEIIGTVKTLTVARNIFGVAQIITSILHLLATLVLSIVFVNLFPLFIKEYILFTLLMLTIIVTVDVLLLHFSHKSHIISQNFATSVTTIDECEAKVKQLIMENKGTTFTVPLEAIAEMLIYANRGMIGTNDSELKNKIDAIGVLIADNKEKKALETIKQTQNILKHRAETTKKTGSF